MPSVSSAVVEAGEFDNDGEAEPGTGLGFVKPLPALRHPLAFGGGKSWPIVVDNDPHFRLAVTGRTLLRDFDRDARLRPLAGVVDQIADHFFEVLLFTAEACVIRHVDRDSDVALAMELLHCARESRHNRRHVNQRGDHA